jgi:threonine/homoserine/homoserine lactone efflux protein
MLVMARGIGQGRGVALFTVLGMTLGAGLVQLPLIAFGLSSLVHASPLAFNLLRWAGAAYIVWLGVLVLGTHAVASGAIGAWVMRDPQGFGSSGSPAVSSLALACAW